LQAKPGNGNARILPLFNFGLILSKIIIKPPKILIYIPTYNRLEQLGNQLEKLAPQIRHVANYLDVWIVVSINDNSFEKYLKIISTYESEKIIFRKNFENIEGNANITLGFVLYDSFNYLWILSDDDYIHSDCLDYIVPAISQGYDFIHIGEYSDIDYKKPPLKLTIFNLFDVTRGAGFGLISTGIISFKYIRGSTHYGFDYMNSSFPHLAIYMAALKKNNYATLGLAEHSKIFTGEVLQTHGGGDYSISLYGFLFLADFYDSKVKKIFLKNWFLGCYEAFFRERKNNPTKYVKASGYLLMVCPIQFFRGYLLYKFKSALVCFKTLFFKLNFKK